MEDLINRLFKFMEFKGLSQNQFEISCGLAHSDLRSRTQGPSASYLMKIITTFPDLNLNWLFLGNGEMILNPQDGASRQIDAHYNRRVVIENWDGLAEVLARGVKSQMK